MKTECPVDKMNFQDIGRRKVEAAFDERTRIHCRYLPAPPKQPPPLTGTETPAILYRCVHIGDNDRTVAVSDILEDGAGA
jgi:hypothetical protein